MGNPFRTIIQPLTPWVADVRQYSLVKLRRDMVAGMTVSVIAIPQAMAYAIIAGVDPIYGLYTMVFQCLIGSLFNSQPLLSVGPINTQSLLVASIVTHIQQPTDPESFYLSMVIALTLIKGVMQILLAAARLGNLVRYISQSVMVGFTAGAGILISAGQINHFLGFQLPRADDHWPGLVGIIQRLSPHLNETSMWALVLGALSLVMVIGLRWISRWVPGPLIAIGVSAGIVIMMRLTDSDLALVPQIPHVLPHLELPQFTFAQLELLLPGALALSLIGLMEAFSIGKLLAAKTGTRISANQELFSQGLTNAATSFLQCMPGSGSFSRSALNHYAGATTRFSSAFNSLFVLVIFIAMAPLARTIPMSTIAAILFVIAYDLIDWRYLLRVIRSNRSDAAVCVGTLAATLLIPLSYAVFVGIFLNLALYLRRARQLYITEMVPAPGMGSDFIERPIHNFSENRRIIFLQIEGNLFFAAADELQDRFAGLLNSRTQVVIFRLKRTHLVDATVMSVIEEFVQQMREDRRWVLLCGLRPRMKERMDEFGLTAIVGEQNMFVSETGVFTSAKRAIQRARELVGGSMDTENHSADWM